MGSRANRLFVSLMVVVIVSGVALAQETAPSAAPAAAPQAANCDAASSQRTDVEGGGLHISSGDLLEVQVYGLDELKREVRVSSSGSITLPLVGSIHVADLTSQQAEQSIAHAFLEGGFIKNPQVSIFVKDYATQGASVLGEVAKPGVYPVLGARRLFDLISAAGGMTPKAGREITIVRRNNPNCPTKIMLSDDPARSTASNAEVSPGDTILVSKAGVVYVVGDVNKPGGFVMESNQQLTVLQAIALAQGVNRTASLKGAKIIRRGPAGIQEIPIQLNLILAAKSSDEALRADDIVFVPASAAKTATRKGLEAILQTATGVAIYRPY